MTTITVSNAAQLIRTLKSARGGETILLAPGNYGDVSLASIQPRSVVTIKSADPNNDALFTSLKLTRVNNLTFDDIDVTHVLAPGEREWESAIRVNASNNISFVGIDLSGSRNGNHFDDGNGLFVQASSRIAVLNSTFHEFNNAVIFNKSSDVILAGNHIQDAAEGVNISEVNGGLFQGNYVTGIRPNVSRGDHSDAFQVQNGGNNGVSNDLVFNNNVIMVDQAQGIFITNAKTSQGVMHTNIVVSNNYIEGNLRHAIGLGGVDGLQVVNNTIRDADGPGIVPGLTTMNLSNAVIANNIIPIIDPRRGDQFASTNLVFTNNIDLWDVHQRRGVADASLFSAPVGTGDIDFSALGVRAGSVAALAGVGFSPVGNIGNLAGSAAAQLASYLPQFDGNFTAAYPM
jgi:hypothetical protein